MLLVMIAAMLRQSGRIYLQRHKDLPIQVEKVCHPNLSHLRHREQGRELLLIGTLPLDISGASQALVSKSLKALKPEVVMVEGSLNSGVNAMIFSGKWEQHGTPAPL